MKIREGHVSNSSSSSYIVTLRDWLKEGETCFLSHEQINILESLGFTRTWIAYPNQVEVLRDIPVQENGPYYCYWHSINHDEIFEPLIEAKIPFRATTHYGNWNVFWNGKSEEILFIPNLGYMAGTNQEKIDIEHLNKVTIHTESIYEYVSKKED